MKNHLKIAAFAIAMFGFSAASYAQETSTTTVSATVAKPITITNTTLMDFGRVANTAATGAGTVALNYTGTPTLTDAKLISGGTAPTPAVFTVAGETDANFTVQLPAATGFSLTKTGGTTPLTVSNFATDAPATITAGSVSIKVKADLSIPNNAETGAYTNTTDFTVTVAYQ